MQNTAYLHRSAILCDRTLTVDKFEWIALLLWNNSRPLPFAHLPKAISNVIKQHGYQLASLESTSTPATSNANSSGHCRPSDESHHAPDKPGTGHPTGQSSVQSVLKEFESKSAPRIAPIRSSMTVIRVTEPLHVRRLVAEFVNVYLKCMSACNFAV